MSRSTIWRALDEGRPGSLTVASLLAQPATTGLRQQSSRDLQVVPRGTRVVRQGRLVICCDEKTGMQALLWSSRPDATSKLTPLRGHARREQDYIRYGTRLFIASFGVPTGKVIGHQTGSPHQYGLCRSPWVMCQGSFLRSSGFDWVLDNLNTHWSLEVCRVVAKLYDVPFVQATWKQASNGEHF